MTYEEKIKDAFSKLNVSLSDEQIHKFIRYYQILVIWNEKMNLTAITEFDEVLLKHFVDSAALGSVFDISQIKNIIDVGTGAGFPGIPLKILYPDLEMVLLDSLNKRIRFLETVIDELKLDHIIAVHGRAEDMGHRTEYREKFDVCVSRAVANLSVLSEYCVPFIKVGGTFISYKSGNVEEEVTQSQNAWKLLHCDQVKIQKMILPDSDLSRSFVMITKTAKLDKKYPRKAGTPSKNPL